MRTSWFLMVPLLSSCSLLFSSDEAASGADATPVDAASVDAAPGDAGRPDALADATPAIDIILDNGDPGTVAMGQWNTATGATLTHGATSLFAVVDDLVDSYRFTPDIPRTAEYEVFAWNSCFSPRHTAVPHTVVHSGGSTAVFVNQDCDTGMAGVWSPLGIYTFEAGSSGYVEISDIGLAVGAEETYIGADAARFVSIDSE